MLNFSAGKNEQTWLLLSTIQFVALLPLMSLQFPANFRKFCIMLKTTNADFDFFPNWIVDFAIRMHMLNLSPFNNNFSKLGFATNYFIINSGKILIIAIILPIGVMVASIFEKRCRRYFSRILFVI